MNLRCTVQVMQPKPTDVSSDQAVELPGIINSTSWLPSACYLCEFTG